jgi:hypothetical protein
MSADLNDDGSAVEVLIEAEAREGELEALQALFDQAGVPTTVRANLHRDRGTSCRGR